MPTPYSILNRGTTTLYQPETRVVIHEIVENSKPNEIVENSKPSMDPTCFNDLILEIFVPKNIFSGTFTAQEVFLSLFCCQEFSQILRFL